MATLREILLHLRSNGFLDEVDLAGVIIETATDDFLYPLIKRMREGGIVIFKSTEKITQHQQEIDLLQIEVDTRLHSLEEKRREVAALEHEWRKITSHEYAASVSGDSFLSSKTLWAGGVTLCAAGLLALSARSSGVAVASRQLLKDASISESARRIVAGTTTLNAAFFSPSSFSRMTSRTSGIVSAFSGLITTWWTRQSMQRIQLRRLLDCKHAELIALESLAPALAVDAESLRQKKEILKTALKAYAFIFPHLQGFSVVRFLNEDSLFRAISFLYPTFVAGELRTVDEISAACHLNIVVHCFAEEERYVSCADEAAPEIHLQYDGAHYHALIPELSLVWQGKYRDLARVQSNYRNKPDPSGITTGGSAIKALYEKEKTKPGSAGTGKDWMGKYAGGLNSVSSSTAAMEPGSRLRIIHTRDAMSEVTAAGFYRFFSENKFAVLKMRLARMSIYNPHHPEGIAILTEAELAGLGPGREQGVHSLCKIIRNYHNLTELVECITDRGILPFQECLDRHILPEEARRHEKTFSLLSLVKALVTAKVIADIDVLGGGGGNAGFQELFDETGQFVGIELQKIDPGFAFAFRHPQAVFHMDEGVRVLPEGPAPDERNIQFGSGGSDKLIYWKLFTEKQRYLFLETFERVVATTQEEGFLDYMLNRGGAFSEPQAGAHAWTLEKIRQLKEDIQRNIHHLQSVYARDLSEENYQRYKRARSVTSLSCTTQFFIPRLGRRSAAPHAVEPARMLAHAVHL